MALFAAPPAWAQDSESATPAPVAVSLHETLDLWRNVQGGVQVGDTQLNKLQIALDLNGDAAGRPGWKARLQYFRTNGESLSGGRVGDIQTVSNIEALSADRLMEAWVERQMSETLTLRAGLMDLNADFDSIEPAALFLDSSHGIAPDLSKSGRNGPSIFPVSALGVHAAWTASKRLTLRAAVFDGVPGDPDHPKALAAVKLSKDDGALVIGQADWAFADGAQVSVAAWAFTARFDRFDEPGRQQQGQTGAYAFIQGPLPVGEGWSGWVRAGIADPKVSLVDGYLGLGIVKIGTFASRSKDRLGFAVSRAALSDAARRPNGLPTAETIVEATYRFQVNRALALQPDLQFVHHPASEPGLKDALVFGFRVTFSVAKPSGMVDD